MPQSNQPRDPDETVSSADRPQAPLDATEGDLSMRDALDDPGSYQSNHGNTGFGGDDDHADPDDAKVQGRSRD
jgi:hypothetical protein